MTDEPPDVGHDALTPPEAAEAYAVLGWPIVPITPGKKHPQLPAWQDAATDNLTTIRSWFTGLYRGHGVGLITGPRSGFWVLDVDVADGKTGAESLADLNDEHGKLPETVTAITGTGGLHLLFAWDPDHPVANGDATELGPGLDIRGTGGQIVVAPTVHPNGRTYQWHPDRHPWALAPADAPAWLYTLIHPPSPVEAPGVAVTIPAAPTGNDDGSIAAWIRDRHNWHTVLSTDGWTIHSTRGDETHWTRPNKDRRDGSSAVLHEPDGPLVIFTTEITAALVRAGGRTVDGSGISVSMFGYLAGTRHAGDRSALARTARHEQRSLNIPAALPAAPQGFVDLGDWWDRQEPQKTADVLRRTDGTGLLYLDQLNWIHGDSGSGKTWILLHAITQLLTAGHHVAWIHYEDPNPATIIGRLKLLGVQRAQAVKFFHYYDPAGEPLDTPALIDLCHTTNIVFVTLDSIGEALNAVGINEDSDAEVGPWITTGPRAIVNAGIGFCGVDHGTKAGTNKLHPSGSKRKRAALTGAGLLVEAVTAPTVTTDGMMRIICAKDRHGNHPQGQTIAMAHLRHNILSGAVDFTIEPPHDTTELSEDDAQHRTRVRAVGRIVAETPGLSKSQVIPLMPTAGRSKRFDAINDAITQRLIRVEIGPRKTERLYPVKAGDRLDL